MIIICNNSFVSPSFSMFMSNVRCGHAMVDGEPAAFTSPFAFIGDASLFTDFIDMMSSAIFAWLCLNFFALMMSFVFMPFLEMCSLRIAAPWKRAIVTRKLRELQCKVLWRFTAVNPHVSL